MVCPSVSSVLSKFGEVKHFFEYKATPIKCSVSGQPPTCESINFLNKLLQDLRAFHLLSWHILRHVTNKNDSLDSVGDRATCSGK